MTYYVIFVALVLAAVALARELYIRWRRIQRAAAILDELIEANRAKPRPGMERRDDRLLQEAGRRRRS